MANDSFNPFESSFVSFSIKFERKTLFLDYKAIQSTNCPFKLEIALKLAHQLGPLEQTTNSCTLNHPILNHEPRVVNTRP